MENATITQMTDRDQLYTLHFKAHAAHQDAGAYAL